MKISIKKIIRTYRARKSAPRLVELEFVNPPRDWFVGLFSVVLCFCVGIAYIAYDFHAQVDAVQDITLEGVDSVSYPERDVLRYADIYREKQMAFEALRGGRPLVVPTEIEPLAPDENEQYTDPVVE